MDLGLYQVCAAKPDYPFLIEYQVIEQNEICRLGHRGQMLRGCQVIIAVAAISALMVVSDDDPGTIVTDRSVHDLDERRFDSVPSPWKLKGLTQSELLVAKCCDQQWLVFILAQRSQELANLVSACRWNGLAPRKVVQSGAPQLFPENQPGDPSKSREALTVPAVIRKARSSADNP